MGFSTKRYEYKTTSVAKKEAMVQGEKYRFTVLTPSLIRAEYSETGFFVDKATQTVVNREFPLVEFTVNENDASLTITTECVKLTYYKRPFEESSLFVKYTGKDTSVFAGRSGTEWMYGEEARNNLGGTARTLDDVDGECPIEKGIMSMGEITVLDDSNSLVINEDGTVSPREVAYKDMYIFCYGDAKKRFDYKAALKALYALCGKTPLLPRFALGNWWSRYHEYTQDEYTELMKRFKAEDIPFSVAVIDMDWHVRNIDTKYGSGWTGYTWNEELFPNHIEFLKFLHNEGLEVTLNLHPQQGVAAHEACYEEMAKAMGIDPKSEQTVEFDITDTKFIENYFEKLHHPLEEEGVDFWWMDWQQGNSTGTPGLDPLWMLNHYHYLDNDRGNKRALTFSRYAGIGSHRYPIGFSGDTFVTWASLDFQPYFTATASNAGYGWWSHDIGGHLLGIHDGELTTRWMQFGVFSPINRLHSNKNCFMRKEPWVYNQIHETVMKKFLKLRHELIPYLYSMNYRAAFCDEPLVMPLYYNWSDMEAYKHKNEYTFGTEMLIMPITTPCDKETTLGNADVYLPEGEWYDFFNNTHYTGDRVLKVYRSIYDMPVFVKAGGIIPMAKLKNVNDINNPSDMIIKVFAGASNKFSLYEDDGRTKEFLIGKSAVTNISFEWDENAKLTIAAPSGDRSVLPEKRSYEIEIIGMEEPEKVNVIKNGLEAEYKYSFTDSILKLEIDSDFSEIEIVLVKTRKSKNKVEEMLFNALQTMEIENGLKRDIYSVLISENSNAKKLSILNSMNISKNVYSCICEILTAED